MHVITGLQIGGAELALWRLLSATDRQRVVPEVVSLSPGGDVSDRIRALDVPVTDLGMTSVQGLFGAVTRLRGLLRAREIEVVQTWMHHADLVGGLAARWAGVPVVWGLRSGPLVVERRSTRAVTALNARLATRLPAAIVACSCAVAEDYAAHGHPAELMRVIPNGYSVDPPSAAAGRGLRARLDIAADALVVGRIGRWHPMKDYAGLLSAVDPILEERPDVHLLLVGDGLEETNPEVRALLPTGPLRSRVHLMGRQTDMAAVYAALDLLISSSSSGEGFPNVIAEAMLSAVPVVTTDVGESAAIVAGTGRVVPPSRPDELRSAVQELLALEPAERRRLGEQARDQTQRRYGLRQMAHAYAELHEQVACDARPAR